MISPDVAAAVNDLERQGLLAKDQARLFRRIALGDLVSLHTFLQGLLFLGVLFVTSGVGLFFKDDLKNLSPATMAGIAGVAAFACLAWVLRTTPPFRRDAVAMPGFAFDALLNIGALVAAADLAYVEANFSPLGERWAWHLLIVSLFYAALAFRFDSRSLFTLSLSSFAAWRGVALTRFGQALLRPEATDDRIRLNVALCGIAFVALGQLLERRHFKAHFEPIAAHLGFYLVLQSIGWGIDESISRAGLVVAGMSLASYAWHGKRFVLFGMGILAAYIGLMVFVAEWVDGELSGLFLFATSSIALVVLLARVHRRFRWESAE